METDQISFPNLDPIANKQFYTTNNQLVSVNELEEFHLALYYAKMEFLAIKDGDHPAPWDSLIQRDIDALYGLCDSTYHIEAHIIAAKTYFRDRTDYPKILSAIKDCCKEQVDKYSFTFAFFNRLNMLNNHK